jgi:hypothetical protein
MRREIVLTDKIPSRFSEDGRRASDEVVMRPHRLGRA